MDRVDFSGLICKRLHEENIGQLQKRYAESGKINHFIIDNLLPKEIAEKLDGYFPTEDKLNYLKRLQERKYVGVNFRGSEKIIEECLLSFQEKDVIKIVSQITSINSMVGDDEYYAGGVSSMSKGCYLRPHIDNSHDRNMQNYRRLNLLYYVNKNWSKQDGGELILYPNGIRSIQIEIPCFFNRLIVMRTDNKSLHGVGRVTSEVNRRKCISNYYFTESSPLKYGYYHSTEFRGFKNECAKGALLRVDGMIRRYAKILIKTFLRVSISTGRHKGGGNDN